MKLSIEKESDLQRVVEVIVNEFLPEKRQNAVVFGLYGNLGAGKTTFTKYLAQALGSQDMVISPTFILERKYALSNSIDLSALVHIDAYRFEEETESNVLQLSRRLSDPNTLFVIEWPEKMGASMPPHIKILFEHTGGDTRKITTEAL